MTITYTAEVATCTKFGCFIKLLARWRGSIYKLVWMDLLLFLFLYYSLSFTYRHILNEDSQKTFEGIVHYCATYSSLIPLSFVLGFYVNLVMTRWWEQYTTIPWPDSIAVFVSAHVHGQDEGGRVMRRTVMRYVCLCQTIVFTMISPLVKKRFPKLKHLVDAGLLLENEKKIIEAMDNAFPKYPKHWMPIIWAASIITRARNEGRIRDDFAVKTIIDELNSFRGRSGVLMYYDFISIPLVYTQVVTIAVYSFFVCSLLAHQWTRLKENIYEGFDFSVPVFITMEFFFYMGWLKVAETLINPFGEDDDDFEVNWMIDRNLQVSYLIVDEMHHEHPELVKDQYWDEVYPTELPYEADAKREQPPESSTAKYDIKDSIEKIAQNADIYQPSLLSIRSERFKEAFQRFSQISEDDVTDTKNHSPTANVSLTDVESLQHVTSYRPIMSSEESIQLKLENLKDVKLSDLVAVPEGEENEMEKETEEGGEDEENDILIEEAEVEQLESSSSAESDSDSDPFERLRLERQQERIARTNAFLQQYFGNNYKIATQLVKPEPKKKKEKESCLIQSSPKELSTFKELSDLVIAPNSIQTSTSRTVSIESNLRRVLSTVAAMSTDDQRNTNKQLAQRTECNSCLALTCICSRSSSTSTESNLRMILNTLPITDTNETTTQNKIKLTPMDLNSISQLSALSKASQTSEGNSQQLHQSNASVKIKRLSSSNLTLHPSTSETQMHLDTNAVKYSQPTKWKDASVSPMVSIISLSTIDSSEVGDWEVMAVDSSPSESEGH